MRWKYGVRLWLALLVIAGPAGADTPSPLDNAHAKAIFSEAETLCRADNGRLWGKPLCGPILLVDPETRAVVANQADAGNVLVKAGDGFTGMLPPTVIVSNTPTSWSGTLWTQMLWPLPADPSARHVTITHELFHRIWADLGFPSLPSGDNRHLDTLEGRYLLQLEWRALAKAMAARDARTMRLAASDALLFRCERYRRFPDAAPDEHALELSEGIAEYTGVRLGLPTAGERRAYAIHDMVLHAQDATFVRSFAYATGPAYGLLLDQFAPDWRSKFRTAPAFDQLLRAGLGLPACADPAQLAAARAQSYDDGSLRAAELAREKDRQARMQSYKARFFDGPVLVLPLIHSNREFRPPTLVPLDGLGVVYPTLRLTDDWGSLEVVGGGGALLRTDPGQALVSLTGASPSGMAGNGWTLKLKPGWSIVTGPRPTDRMVSRDAR